jgi:hypothetical protein
VGATVTLLAPSVAVEPGSTASIEFRVRNTGSVVDVFGFSVLGGAAGWGTVVPAKLSLFPGAEETAKVVFAPPRSSSVPAGPMPFGLHAQSREDPAGSTVEEGTVDVAPFQEPFAELIPRTSRGSRSASHDLAIDNRGNLRLNAEVEAADADRLLAFDLKPPGVVIDPGQANFAKLRVRPTKRFWRGTPQTRPFQVYVRSEGAPPITLDGALLQEPMLPPWFMRAMLALLALVIGLVLLWFLFLQPQIDASAEAAAASASAQVSDLEDRVNDALADQGLATVPPEGEEGGGGEPTEPAEPTPSPTPLPPGVTPPPATPTPAPTTGGGAAIPGVGTPLDGRLDQSNLNFTAASTVFITDLVFSNPNGASGNLALRRDGVTLFPIKLENIRDYDLHFVTPLVLNPGQTLNLSLTSCSNPCDPAVFYSGYERP